MEHYWEGLIMSRRMIVCSDEDRQTIGISDLLAINFDGGLVVFQGQRWRVKVRPPGSDKGSWQHVAFFFDEEKANECRDWINRLDPHWEAEVVELGKTAREIAGHNSNRKGERCHVG